jgi:hypothetical protein
MVEGTGFKNQRFLLLSHQRHRAAKRRETWREMVPEFLSKYLYHTSRDFNMPLNLTIWSQWLHFSSNGSRVTDFYRPQEYIAVGRVF